MSDIHPNAIGPNDGFPKIMLDATGVSYGDLTGDDRAEAVVEASCAASEEGLDSGHGGQLLVVARADDGTLAGLAWTGPPGADFQSYWVAGGRLLVDADPWTAAAADQFPAVPGLALSYRWDGERFAGWEPAPEYPPMVPLDAGEPGPPVRLRAVAGGLGCPDTELRFNRDEPGWDGRAVADGADYTIPVPPFQPYLFDLDNTGDRLLVTALHCTREDGSTTAGLAVFERLERAGDVGEGWQGISVLLPPPGHELGGWRLLADRFLVEWVPAEGATAVPTTPYRWTGTELVPIDD